MRLGYIAILLGVLTAPFAAYGTERYVESLLASNLLLAKTTLPPNFKECVETNLKWVNEKISEIHEPTYMKKN